VIQIVLHLFKKVLRYVLVPLLVIALLWSAYFLLYGNFHKVDKDIYRSAQLFSHNMPYYIEKHKIKSIINLRGESKRSWYKNEIAFAKEHNITMIDYGIGDREMLPLNKMDALLDIMKKAPKPLLIHCKAGADRTSLASALYVYDKTGDKNPSMGFSLRYGHFPWLGSKTVAMDKSFAEYKQKR